jgi:hypothetical protein
LGQTTASTATTGARSDEGWLPPLLAYAAVLAVLLVVSWQTTLHTVENTLGISGRRYPGDWFWGGWLRFDGNWYVGIAEVGYSYTPGTQSSVAFFPGYPLAVRTVGGAIDNLPLGGTVVTVAAGIGVLALFWRWCTARMARPAALAALGALALYPYAWYLYGAVYGDALFVVTVLAAFTLLERDAPILAGLVGIAATATRLVGVALLVGLVVGVLERRGAFEEGRWHLPRRVSLRCLRPRDAGVALAAGGLLAWMAWLWHRFGDPFLFSSVQAEWGQETSLRTIFKMDFAWQLLRGTDHVYAYGLLVQALLALGVLLLLPAVRRRFGLRYAAYTAVLVALPLVGSQDFQGTGRYLIGAFPAFAVVGCWMAERPARAKVALPISALLLMIGTALFAHGLYLS